MTAVRQRVGRDMKLMNDPASSLTSFLDAVEVGRACDDLGFFWYEDPYRDASSSAVAHKRLRDFIRTPMLIAEHIRGFEQKADFALAAGGTDIMHIDPELDGGITGTMKLAHFCDAIGMEVQLHTAGPMHRHCMAAIANTHFYELGLVRPDIPANILQPPIYADDYGDEIGRRGGGRMRARAHRSRPGGCVRRRSDQQRRSRQDRDSLVRANLEPGNRSTCVRDLVGVAARGRSMLRGGLGALVVARAFGVDDGIGRRTGCRHRRCQGPPTKAPSSARARQSGCSDGATQAIFAA